MLPLVGVFVLGHSLSSVVITASDVALPGCCYCCWCVCGVGCRQSMMVVGSQ